MRIRSSVVPWFFVSAVTIAAMTGCEFQVDSRGNAPDPKRVAAIKPGVHKRQDVEQRLGAPSTIATFDNEIWYYISGKVKSVAFFKPKLVERTILTVKFDKNGIVQKVHKIDTTKQKEIPFVKRETPTKGKELTFIQQIIGNLGKYTDSSRDNQ